MRKIGRFALVALAAILSLRAIAYGVQEKPSAPDALTESQRHQSLAISSRSADDYAAAISHAEQALALRERALGPNAIEVARSLLLLGQLNDRLAKYEVGERFFVRAQAIVDRNAERDELLLAEIRDSLAADYVARGRFREAEPLIKEALATRERILGASDVSVAASLATLADLHHEMTSFQEARTAADRAFEIAANAYPPTDIRRGEFIDRAARAQLALGNYSRAEQLYRDSLAIREPAAGKDSLVAAESVGGLARVALLASDNVKAEELHLRSLAIKERVLGPDHPQVANDLSNLGLIQYRRRDFANAIGFHNRALAIRQRVLGGSHPVIAQNLNNIGLVYWRQLDYPRAEEFFRRALELSERLYGPDSFRLTTSLGNLGVIAKETGDYALAEARYQRALAIREKHLGRDHPDLIAVVESLAILYRDRGDFARADEVFRRTIQLTTSSLGADHPFLARHYGNVAHLNWAMGRFEEALAARQRFLAIEELNLPLNLSVGSERQKLAYFEPFLKNVEKTISFHIQGANAHAVARDLAITTLLQRKGRILDALADSWSAFRNRSSPEDRALLDRFSKVTADLAAAVLSGSKPSALAEQRERLEIELQQRSAGYLDRSRPVSLAAVQAAIPSGAALIEFAVYRPFDPHAAVERGDQFGTARYVVYVVPRSGEPRWKDLGPAAEIDALVDRFRATLADPARTAVSRLARQLHEKLVAPLEPLLGDTTHLVISPDGQLTLIPFEALRGADGRYLVELRSVSYVTTGRDLVRMLEPRPPASRSAVFADPAFDRASAEQASPAPKRTPTASRAGRRSITTGKDLSVVYFAPLAGTATEAQRIRSLFPEAELKIGVHATEQAMKNLQAPRILHVATHGFFLQEGIENPLLRSGLAFTAANLPRTSGDDGILTALEASNLNLWGTKLVTLSACDTGVGVVRNGEGVYGLRRAFFLAGAESLVMSLWPVSDLVTREMMTGYYAGLNEGLGRNAALRRVQLQMLKRKGRSHPFYWASFIQAGEWASLDGRR